MVTWGSLTADHNNSWNELSGSLVGWSAKDALIPVNDVQDVHQLSLVLMDSFDLNIIHCVEWNIISSIVLYPLSQNFLVSSFNCNELIQEILIICVSLDLF